MTLGALITGPLGWVQRTRVGLGFTVHSPFAFRFIRGVLRERLPYYCFRSELQLPDEQLLFRVANFIGPQTVAFVDDCARARRAVALACPRAVEVADPAVADLTYALDSVPPRFGGALFVCNAPKVRSLDAMTFTNGRTLIAFRRPGLPHQRFSLNF